MIRFFSSLLPSRWVVLVLLYLLIRLPLIFFGFPTTLSELHHVLLGERLQDGFVLYRDIYDTTSPLSGALFWLLDLLVGKSYFIHRLTATVLLGYQAFLLNHIFNRNQVYPQKTFLPAVLYLLLGSVSFELDVLSPLLFGNTFVILAVYSLTSISKEAANTRRLFKAGFMLGLAGLSYLPLVWFLILAFIAVIYFASNAFRSTLLTLTGFVFPFSVVFTIFLYLNGSVPFLEQGLAWSWQFKFSMVLPFSQVISISALPIVILVLSLFSLPFVNLGLNYQARFLQFMLIWLLVAIFVLISGHDGSAQNIILILPVIAYFGVFLFSWRGKKFWIVELLFLVLIAAAVTMRYNPLGMVYSTLKITPELIQVKEDPKYQQVKDQPLLVLGPDLNYYQNNKIGSPYFRWDLATPFFGKLNEYDALFTIYQDLQENPPAYIVDQVGLMPALQYKLPVIFQRYERVEAGPYYRRIR